MTDLKDIQGAEPPSRCWGTPTYAPHCSCPLQPATANISESCLEDTHVWLYKIGPGSSRELAPLGVVLHQQQMEDGETTLIALRKGPKCTASQVPTVGTCSSTHLVLAPLPSLSHFPILLTVLPGITSQVNYLH